MTDSQKAIQTLDDMLASLSFFKADASGADLIRDILKDYEKDKQHCLAAQQHTLRLIDKTQALVKTLHWIGAYIHTYCIIIHPKTDAVGEQPEKVLLNKIDEALADFKKVE